MTTAVDQIRQLQRTEADLVASRSILSCLADADACPPEWVDEFDRLRSAQYSAELSTYARIVEKLRVTNPSAYQAIKARPFSARLIPGLPPRLVGKVEAKRAKGTDPAAPDGADLLVAVMRRPPHWGQSLPIDAEAVALDVVRMQRDGYGLIWPYFVAVGVGALVAYLYLDEDPTIPQMEIQADEYHEFLSVVGPVLRQVGSGMSDGTISAQQASTMLATLQAICPAGALPAVPGATSCTFGSCLRWFVMTTVVAAGGVLLFAAVKGAFRVTPQLEPVRTRVLFPRKEPKRLGRSR
jgi:hypothetical protein